MKSNLISKNETADMLREISGQWGFEVPRSKNLRVHHLEDGVLLIESPQLKALKIDGSMIPFLTGTDILAKFPHAVVDMGAVKFMCNGANVMRPGIVEYSEFSKGDIVCIVEESRRKPLAVGRAVVDSSELEGTKRGEVVKNLHYVSDRFWETAKTIFK